MGKVTTKNRPIKPDAAYLAKVAASQPRVVKGNCARVLDTSKGYARTLRVHTVEQAGHWEFKGKRGKR